MELSLRLGIVGVIQANTYERRTNLVGAEDWSMKFMGGGVTWPSTQINLYSSMNDYVGNLLRTIDRTNGQKIDNVEIM